MTDRDSVWDRPEFVQRRKIDLLCREFEDAWQAGSPVSIEDFLAEADSALHEALCGELIACEFELRTRSGEQPSATEYLRRFPGQQSVIAALSLDRLEDESGLEQSRNSKSVTASRSQLEPGDEFAGYRILRRLGAGGMGKVYLAEIPVISHAVALKILEVHSRHREPLAIRFEREARILSKLDHPGIVPLYAYGESDGLRYLVMKAVAGMSLADALSGDVAGSASSVAAQPPADSALHTLLQVIRNPEAAERVHLLVGLSAQLAEALAAVHDAGILHRDIKPSNILLTTDGKPVLTDFGLAKDEAGTDDLTLRGEFIGTPRYAAPEAIDGRFSKQSDLYSLGLVLFELFSLKTPCGGASLRNLLNSKLRGEVPELVATGWAAPHVEQAIRRLLDPVSENRTQSASEFLNQLTTAGSAAPQTVGFRFRWQAIGLVAATIVILLTVVVRRIPLRQENPGHRKAAVARRLPADQSSSVTQKYPRREPPPMERDEALTMRAEFRLPEGVLPRRVAISSDASIILIASRTNEVFLQILP